MTKTVARPAAAARHVAVVGAGPGGLAAGIALRRLGFDVSVFEQAPQMEAVGGGILLHSNGLRALSALGVLPKLEPKLRYSGRMALESVGGAVLLSVLYADLPVPHPHSAVVLRYDLVDALLETAKEYDVPLFLDQKFSGITVDANGVSLALTCGKSGTTETRTFDALVACDGVHSPIRNALGLLRGAAPRPLPPWLRASAPVATPDSTIREIWGDDGRSFGIMPLPGDETHFFCSAPPRETWNALLSDPSGVGDWIDGWAAFGPEVHRLARSVPNWATVHYGSPAFVQVKAWHKGPVFLVGDAAHAMPPNLGQGANAALVDALVLARTLANENAKAQLDWELAGRVYQNLRGPFMRKTQEVARELGFLAHQTAPLVRLLRDEALIQSARIAPIRERAVEIAIGHNPPEDPYLTPLPDPIQ